MIRLSYRHLIRYGAAVVVLFNVAFAAFLQLRPVPHASVVTVDDIVAFVGPLLPVLAYVLLSPGSWVRGGVEAERPRRPGPLQRWAPLCLILGAFSFGIGEIIWAYDELVLRHPSPFPSWADAAFLAVYPLLFVGILVLPQRLPSAVSRTRIVLDGLLIMTALVTFRWYFILGPTMLSGTESPLARVVGTAYPLFDLMLVFCVLVLTGRNNGPLLLRQFLSILENRQLTAHVRRQLDFTGAMMRSLGEGVYALDMAGRVTYMNSTAERMLGWTEAELLGKNLHEIVHAGGGNGSEGSLCRMMAALRRGDAIQREEDVFVRKDGSRLPVAYSASPIESEGQETGMAVVFQDITERQRAVAALAYQALHDALTGLPNRALLRDRLQQSILAAQRQESPLALFFMDLDRFKEVNDTFGHHCGDALLQQLAFRLQKAVREDDTVARLGGDEFAVLLPSTDEDGAAVAARKLIAALEQPFEIEGHVFDVGTSIGCALHPEHGADASTLMRKADVAMYSAKRTDREYASYSPDHDKNDPARLVLMRELRCAIDEGTPATSPAPLLSHGRLLLHYQPQLNVKIGCTDHVEALIRWQHPERGLLFPGAFVPWAEETGLLEPLTRWVLGEALHQCALWQAEGQDIRVAVNLSGRSLHDPQLVDTIATALESSGIKASSLQFEITESAIIVNPERARETLNRLHDMGVQVAIDDFGTGYSSLAYLKRLPIDDIKIDRSFVTNLTENSDNAFIVQSVIDLGHNLGLEVIAEGVENAATYDCLARMGCDMIQGYYLSPPLAPDDLTCWYESMEDTRAAG